MKNKSFAVIGLGQFGMTLAVTLAESDCDVLAIDDKEENIEEISEKVTYAVKADVREPGILKALGVQNVDVAIIAVAENLEASISATMQAKDLGVPFVLYLVAGIVPWFFFQDALMGGTNSLLEYNYLVKKVVFNISVLPVVKIISAMFVHAFFVLFTIILYAAYGKFPDFYYLQIIYYSVCVFILVLGLSYATSAIVIFFRDLTQIINIVLQVGVWLTPIMWIVEASPLMGHPVIMKILKLNPMYYIVSGYRDTFLMKTWFWEHAGWTVYFWIFTILCFLFGSWVFKRLRIHFADVL